MRLPLLLSQYERSIICILAVWAIAIDSSVLFWWQFEGMDGKELHDFLPATTEPKRTLVVYSGPSSSKEEKLGLYEANLKYFLANGGVVDDCGHDQNIVHDTVIVVGKEFYRHYAVLIENWKADRFNTCHQQTENKVDETKQAETSRVWVVGRRPICRDLETAHLAFYGGLGVNILDYDYFVFVNCGLSGPGPMPNTTPPPWTTVFTSKLSDKVKMSGLTINTLGLPPVASTPHVQTFLYALDRIGMEIMMNSGAIFDCTNKTGKVLRDETLDIVVRYEIGMGKAILDSGYAMSPLHDGGNPACAQLSNETKGRCVMPDLWFKRNLKKMFGHVPSLEECFFFKTSRFLTREISKLINYTDDSLIA